MRYLLLLLALPLLATDVTVTLPDGTPAVRTLQSHPRGWFDGPSGTITANIKDPDGSGPLKAPYYSHPVAVAARTRASSKRGNLTDEAVGIQTLLLALNYYMDNTGTLSNGATYLQEFKDALLRSREDFRFGGCLYTASMCGTVSADYAGEGYGRWALAYTLMRDALTAGERTMASQMFFNGVGDPSCDFRLVHEDGVITKVGTAITLSGASWDASIAVGKQIALRNASQHGGAINWFRITAYDGTTVTVDASYPDYAGTATYYTVAPWTSTSCSFGHFASSHPNVPGYIVSTETVRLAAPISATSPAQPASGGVSENITINTSNWAPLNYRGDPVSPPFLIRVTTSEPTIGEIMRVTAVSGTTLTVQRGELDTTLSHLNNAVVVYWPVNKYDTVSAAFGLDNRNLTRAQSLMLMATALADENAEAVNVLEKASEYFYANTYLQATQYWTLHNTSAPEYGMGRVAGHYPSLVLNMLNSFTTPVDFRGDYLKQQFGLHNIYWSTPWDNRHFMRFGIEAGGQCATASTGYKFAVSCMEGPIVLNMLYPTDNITQYMNYQHITRNSFYADMLTSAVLQSDGSWVEGIPALRYLLAGEYTGWLSNDFTDGDLPTSQIWDSGQNSDPGVGLGTFVSRTNWTSAATQLWGLYPDTYSDKFAWNDPHGTYAIGKGSGLTQWAGFLVNSRTTPGLFEYAAGPGLNNTVDFGNTYKAGIKVNKGDLPSKIVGKAGDDNYFWATVDSIKHNTQGNSDYHQVTRQMRHFAHFKTSPEYIFVVDDVAKGNSERIRSFIGYPQNGGGGEGTSQLDAAANYMDSRNSAAKIITQFALNGSTVPKLYDLGVSLSGATTTIGIDCTVAAPCRVRSSGTTYNFTQSYSFTAVGPASTAAAAYVFVYVNASGQVEVGANAAVTTTLGSGIVDGGTITDFPGNAILRLSKIRYITTGPTSSQCPGALSGSVYASAREWGTCVGLDSRVVFMDAGAATAARFVAFHRPTTTLAETATAYSFLGTITQSSNFEGIEVEDTSVNRTYLIYPKGGSKYSALTFTTTHASGTGRYMVSGLLAGNYTVTRDGGAFSTPTVGNDGTYFFTTTSGQDGDWVFTFDSALALNIETTSISPVLINTATSVPLSVVGGIPTYSCAVTSGALPTGITLTGATCTLAGTPTVAGSYTFTVTVTDSATPSASTDAQAYTWEIVPSIPLAMVTTSVPDGENGEAYSTQVTCQGGTTPYTYSKPTGTLPTGASLNTSTGAITGTLSAAGDFSFSIACTDSAAASVSRSFSMTVNTVGDPPVPVTISTASLPNARVNFDYNDSANGYALIATGGTAPYTWALSSGSLPAGIELSVNGVLSGIATANPGTYCGNYIATDSLAVDSAAKALCVSVIGNATKTRTQTVGLKALVSFTVPSIDAASTCTYSLLDDTDTEVDSGTVPAGPASRWLIATAPSAGNFRGTWSCMDGRYTGDFALVAVAPSGTGSFSRTITPPSGRGITHARLLVGSVGGALTGQTPVACSTGCTLTYTGSVGVYDLQHQWCTSSDCLTGISTTSRTETVVVR